MGQRGVKIWVVAAGLSFSLIGCNEFQATTVGENSSSLADNGSQSAPATEPVNMEALNKELDNLDISIADVEKEISVLDIPALSAGTAVQGKMSEKGGIDGQLRKVFDKLLDAVTKVMGKSDELKAQIQAKMAKLDPTNPLHLVAIVKLNEALAYLDELKQRLGDQLRLIVGKLGDAVAKVDNKIAQMDQSKPATWAIMILWQQVKVVVLEYKDKLLAAIP